MKNYLLLLVLASCTTVPLAPNPGPSPTPSPTATPVPTDRISFVCEECNAREKSMLPVMQKLLNEVVQSSCFAEHLLDSKFRSELVQTNGLSRVEVVKKLTETTVKNIPLSFYYDDSSGVYGYTYPDDDTIYLNRWYRTQEDYDNGDWGICAEVSNEAHEASHKMGFDHDFKNTSRRPYSVPYSVNYAVDACCDDKKGASK